MFSRNLVKRALGKFSGLSPRVQKAVDDGLTIFAFHDVTDRPSEFTKRYGLYASTTTFESQVRWIKKNFKLIAPTEILENCKLPQRAAIVSFDDGFRGTFDNGLQILEKLEVPSIIFLNMAPILQSKPLLSAVAFFLEKSNLDFSEFCINAGISRPFHLSLTPEILERYRNKHGLEDKKAIAEFQGEIADIQIVKKWDGHPLVYFGNHLFEHWNSKALTEAEFDHQYSENEAVLKKYSSNTNLFAFTNGQPNTCFTLREIKLLSKFGSAKAFSTRGGVNRNRDSFLLGRVALCEADNSDSLLWFRIFRAIQQENHPEELIA